ncbi:glycoside hydrolase family 43 protein [Kineococcus sp. TBRC 1896]|uniref:Glycoside hydrolase family 43 protein n=1 Tax=Kineococcus mangrovi TaxID=1660183 RepID=A0ABV4HYG2_9ACTN
MADDDLQVPLDALPVHDPFVLPVAHDGTYRLYQGVAGDPAGVEVRHSRDLRTWSAPRRVFSVPDGCWADPSCSPWAPEVHAWGGRYHLLTTLHQPAAGLPPARQGGTTFLLRSDESRWRLDPAARGTVVAVADDPDGPFTLVDPTGPVPPAEFMTLDGTLALDRDGRPWLVYAHEWVQLLDGTVEAVPLRPDLSAAAGDPVHLFRGSEASWQADRTPRATALAPYVTDGPQLRRLPGGALACLWSSYRGGGTEYVQTWALSRSGDLTGPWEQREVLVGGGAGHGMLFETFEGRTALVLHRGMGTPTVRAEFHEVDVSPDSLAVRPWRW